MACNELGSYLHDHSGDQLRVNSALILLINEFEEELQYGMEKGTQAK